MMLNSFYSLPILMYHSISRALTSNAVAPEIFKEHCATLARTGWRTLSLQEVENCFLEKAPLPPKSCLITFDDGYLDNWLHAAPVLERYNLRGVIFPVLSELEKNSPLCERKNEVLPCDTIVLRKGQKVLEQRFCSVSELREMNRREVLTPAPHSLRHNRVVAGPKFKKLLRPGGIRGWFSLPPYGAIWGMPNFSLGHALTTRAFLPSRRLLKLVQNIVPQQFDEAKDYLSVPRNRAHLLRRIRTLEVKGLLGRMESEEEYRKRLEKEFTLCRTRFFRFFGTKPVSFCWPWGDYNDTSLEEARRAGFRLFFTTLLGANTLNSTPHLRRFKVREISGRCLLWEMRMLSVTPLANLAAKWQRMTI